MARSIGKISAKQALRDWDEFRANLLAETMLEEGIGAIEIRRRLAVLEADPEKWIGFFIQPKYPFSAFHKRFFRRIKKAIDQGRSWYEVLSWARELAKTSCVMYLMLYLALTKKKRNFLLVSATWDAAAEYLEEYRAQLDSNQRIKAYYGEQRSLGAWEYGDFTTRGGARFLAKGKGQTPRGTKKGGIRPEVILPDDFDTDESVRNPDTVKADWAWFESALYPTRSISEPLLVIWCGNIIAKDCCITRAGKAADNWDVVNIRDEEGKSTWPEKNSEQDIDDTLRYMSTKAQQQEYYNNPLSEGEIIREVVWGKCPPLSKLECIVSYADPSPSNSDRRKVGVSFKANFLVGYHDGKFYVYNGFLDQVPNAEFVLWNYALRDYVRERTQIIYKIENNTLQDPFYEQVYIPLFQKYGREKGFIPISPDTRKKPDKAARIEGNLEPLIREGLLILNEAERGNPHMQRLEEQFKLFTPQLKAPADGPDCIEGAVYILNERIRVLEERPSFGRRIHKNIW